MRCRRVVLGPRGERVTGNELTSFFPEDNEEAAYSHGARTGADGEPGEMVLPEQQEFERAVYFLEIADDIIDGEEWCLRSSA
ncbi:hypothetical protein MLD38_017937 [Melastoma candidum]|uniref:Uncharacterized protein n=1 Tax=Melastoma candidum TaxID=119954 RepID=A0ACB9R0G7_9MYRT|nr:hypothetical protein MLD38_017937 [Melastoma candidum]